LKKLIKKKAQKYELEFELVAAVIWQESKGNPWASRVEDDFYDRYIKNLNRATLPGFVPSGSILSLRTEKRHRATSWGLMQVMGETMRERGYRKNDITRLCVPAINLEYGCRFLKHLIQKSKAETYQETLKKALSAYNTGRTTHENTQYDEKILSHIFSGVYNQMFE